MPRSVSQSRPPLLPSLSRKRSSLERQPSLSKRQAWPLLDNNRHLSYDHPREAKEVSQRDQNKVQAAVPAQLLRAFDLNAPPSSLMPVRRCHPAIQVKESGDAVEGIRCTRDVPHHGRSYTARRAQPQPIPCLSNSRHVRPCFPQVRSRIQWHYSRPSHVDVPGPPDRRTMTKCRQREQKVTFMIDADLARSLSVSTDEISESSSFHALHTLAICSAFGSTSGPVVDSSAHSVQIETSKNSVRIRRSLLLEQFVSVRR